MEIWHVSFQHEPMRCNEEIRSNGYEKSCDVDQTQDVLMPDRCDVDATAPQVLFLTRLLLFFTR